MRDLARRSFRWRVPLRWYLISLLAPLLIFLIAVTILYGFAPLRALGQNWLLLFTAFLPALAIMILLNNVAEEIGWTGFVFARFQETVMVRSAPPSLTGVFFWLFHVSSFLCRHAIMGNHGIGAGHLPAAASGQPIHHRLALQRRRLQRVDRRIVPAMHNAIVNSTGLVAVVALPQFEVLVIMAGIVVLAAAIIAVATRGRLGLRRPESDAALAGELDPSGRSSSGLLETTDSNGKN